MSTPVDPDNDATETPLGERLAGWAIDAIERPPEGFVGRTATDLYPSALQNPDEERMRRRVVDAIAALRGARGAGSG